MIVAGIVGAPVVGRGVGLPVVGGGVVGAAVVGGGVISHEHVTQLNFRVSVGQSLDSVYGQVQKHPYICGPIDTASYLY